VFEVDLLAGSGIIRVILLVKLQSFLFILTFGQFEDTNKTFRNYLTFKRQISAILAIKNLSNDININHRFNCVKYVMKVSIARPTSEP
jgi:hypothetical protein